MAKTHGSTCKHQRKKHAFKNNAIKTGNGPFNQTAKPFNKIKRASHPHTVNVQVTK